MYGCFVRDDSNAALSSHLGYRGRYSGFYHWGDSYLVYDTVIAMDVEALYKGGKNISTVALCSKCGRCGCSQTVTIKASDGTTETGSPSADNAQERALEESVTDYKAIIKEWQRHDAKNYVSWLVGRQDSAGTQRKSCTGLRCFVGSTPRASSGGRGAPAT